MKNVIFFASLMVLVPIGTLAASISPRIRELVFFALVFSTATIKRLDINFLSREMYRGSTRGIEFSYFDFLVWILLLSCLISPPPGKPRIRWPAGLGFLLAYVAYCGLSIMALEPRIFSIFEFTKILRGVVVFIAVANYIRKPRDVLVLVMALCAIAVYSTSVSLHQRYVLGMHRIPGPLDHYNEFSEYCCIIAPVLAAVATSDRHVLVRWLCAGCAAALGICVILTISRTGIAVYAIVMFGVIAVCSGLTLTPKKIVIGILIMAAVGGALYRSWDSLMSRYAGTSLEEEYLEDDMQGRGMYLHIAAVVVQDHFFGVGLNNWSYVVTEEYYPRLGHAAVSYGGTDINVQGLSKNEYTHMMAPPAHNLGALTIGELGVPGFIIFYLIWGRWFQMGASFFRGRSRRLASRLGIGAFFGASASFLQCLTEYGFRHSHIFFLMHILMGALAAAYTMHDTDETLSGLIRADMFGLRGKRATQGER